MVTGGQGAACAKPHGPRAERKTVISPAQFKRLATRRGIKRALMAVAHSILIIAYTMIKKNPVVSRARGPTTAIGLTNSNSKATSYGDYNDWDSR
jgi:hypothetical protein